MMNLGGDIMSAIGFKSLGVFGNMVEVPWYPQLTALVKWLLVRVHQDRTCTNVFVTSAYRKDDKGVHGQIPLRGLDIRSTVFEDPEKLCEDINNHWEYDLDRPEKQCAIYHDIGKGFHIHLQVHPKTKYLGG